MGTENLKGTEMKFIDIDCAERRRILDSLQAKIGLKSAIIENYSSLQKATLAFIPPSSVYDEWKKDYETMQEEMIYGESLPFDEMIAELREFNNRINRKG